MEASTTNVVSGAKMAAVFFKAPCLCFGWPQAPYGS